EVLHLVSCANGVAPAATLPELAGLPYCAGAMVPRGGFAPVADAAPDEEPPDDRAHDFVAIFSIAPALTPFRSCLHPVQSKEDADAFCRHDAFGALVRGIVRSARSALAFEEAHLDVRGICLAAPDRPTATVDARTGLLVGLHLDSWDRLDLSLRAAARN